MVRQVLKNERKTGKVAGYLNLAGRPRGGRFQSQCDGELLLPCARMKLWRNAQWVSSFAEATEDMLQRVRRRHNRDHGCNVVRLHTGAEGGEFMCHERLVNARCSLHGQRDWDGIHEGKQSGRTRTASGRVSCTDRPFGKVALPIVN